MPIYEFYCGDCHTIYNFLSKRVDTQTRPPCPHCAQQLSREVSLFAASKRGKTGESADGDELPVDESRLERAMEGMADEIEGIDENDPRQAAQVMRQFAQASGVRFNSTIEEALSRMESGEDPEALEAEMGEVLENENPFATDEGGKAGARHAHRVGPRRDPKLYEM